VVNAALGALANPQVVAPGSYVAIYGANLSSAGAISASGVPLTTNLNGVELLLGGRPMPLLYASPTQVTGLVPETSTSTPSIN